MRILVLVLLLFVVACSQHIEHKFPESKILEERLYVIPPEDSNAAVELWRDINETLGTEGEKWRVSKTVYKMNAEPHLVTVRLVRLSD